MVSYDRCLAAAVWQIDSQLIESGDRMSTPCIPVLVDDVKTRDDFPFSRCIYFTIECDDRATDWVLRIQSMRIPFLMLGLSGIIYAPDATQPFFDTPDDIQRVFDTIEREEALYVDVADIWLPNSVLTEEPKRGDVFRLGYGIFTSAYQFRQDMISRAEFDGICREHRSMIAYSDRETAAFRVWVRKQIMRAKELYPKDPELALQWTETNYTTRG